MRVAVLRGGPSPEYEVSLKTGENVLSILRGRPERYEPLDIFISRDGTWHRHGLPTTPDRALRHIDVVWNGLHGSYGEDGQVQSVLASMRVPYTGSEALGSALAMNKDMSKEVFRKSGLNVPRHAVLGEGVSYDDIVYIFRNFPHPVVVKPTDAGSSIGVKIAHGIEDLKEAVANAFRYSKKVLVEEFIRGKEATCAVVDGLRGQKVYALIPVEIQKPPKSAFFDYEAKYSGESKELCPGTFTTEENKKIEEAARLAHSALGLRHYSRSDFVLTKKGDVYILETNSLPGFTKESLLPKSLAAVSLTPEDFVEHVISLTV